MYLVVGIRVERPLLVNEVEEGQPRLLGGVAEAGGQDVFRQLRQPVARHDTDLALSAIQNVEMVRYLTETYFLRKI